MFLGWQGDSSQLAHERVLKHFSQEDIDRGQEYARNGFIAKAVSGYVWLAVIIILIFSGFFSALNTKIESFTNGGFWLPNLLFFSIFFLIQLIINFPFSYYLGHVCETQMGFSNMTAIDWFIRYLKSVAVSWILEAIIVLLIFWVFKFFERSWPILVPAATTLFGIAATILMPYIITPIFYNQKPIAEGQLKERILEIARQAKVPVEGIYEIDESRYSKHTNAYFTGLFSEKRIVLYDTLIKSHTVDEAALIFAHEVGHWLYDHVLIGITLGFFGALLGSFFLWWLYPFFLAEPSFGLGPLWKAQNLPFFIVVTTVLNLLLSPIEAQISQYFERQADYSSLELTGLHKTFIEAETRLAKDNKNDLLPHPFRVFWLYSHPPAIDRIEMGLTFGAASSKTASTTESTDATK